MEIVWNPSKKNMESIWKRYGIHLEKVWNPSPIPWNPSPHSMEFLQSIPPSMDSTWNNPGRVKYCKLPHSLLADSPLKLSPISLPVPLQPLLLPESMHTPNTAAGTEWVVHSDGAALEVELDVYPQPLPHSSPETISTPQSSMGVPMLAFAYIS